MMVYRDSKTCLLSCEKFYFRICINYVNKFTVGSLNGIYEIRSPFPVPTEQPILEFCLFLQNVDFFSMLFHLKIIRKGIQ